MFEYINLGFVIFSVIFIFLSMGIFVLTADEKDDESKSSHKSAAFAIVVASVAPFLYSIYTKSVIDKNIKLFKANQELICSNFLDTHLVSIDGGWSVNNDSFLKDSLLIIADRCSKGE